MQVKISCLYFQINWLEITDEPSRTLPEQSVRFYPDKGNGFFSFCLSLLPCLIFVANGSPHISPASQVTSLPSPRVPKIPPCSGVAQHGFLSPHPCCYTMSLSRAPEKIGDASGNRRGPERKMLERLGTLSHLSWWRVPI